MQYYFGANIFMLYNIIDPNNLVLSAFSTAQASNNNDYI
jgi:hypothetical protein